jgi:hypothetical protein
LKNEFIVRVFDGELDSVARFGGILIEENYKIKNIRVIRTNGIN